MSVRSVWPRGAAPVVAVALGVLSIAMGAATVLLDSITHQAGTGGPVADALAVTAVIVPTTAVGTLLAARRPRNPIGWLILAIVIGQLPNSEYAVLDYRMHHGTLPLGSLAVVLDTPWPLSLFSIAVLLWLFPDGKMPAGRWRRPSRVLAGARDRGPHGSGRHGCEAGSVRRRGRRPGRQLARRGSARSRRARGPWEPGPDRW